MKWTFAILLFIPIFLFGQEEAPKDSTRFEWGFNVGFCAGFINPQGAPTQEALVAIPSTEVHEAIGAFGGVSFDIKLNEKWNFRPEFSLQLLPTTITFHYSDISNREGFFFPITSDFPLHLAWKPFKKDDSYALNFGPRFSIFNNLLENFRPIHAPLNISGDLGFSKRFDTLNSYVILSLIYSHGFSNLQGKPTETPIPLHDLWFERLSRNQLSLRVQLF